MYRTSLEQAPLAVAEGAAKAGTDAWRTVAGWAWAIYLTGCSAVAAWALLS